MGRTFYFLIFTFPIGFGYAQTPLASATLSQRGIFLLKTYNLLLTTFFGEGLRGFSLWLWLANKYFLNFEKIATMLVERSNDNQIVITISSSVDAFGLQRVIDHVKYLEATSGSKAKQADVDKLADEVNASWWANNSKRLLK